MVVHAGILSATGKWDGACGRLPRLLRGAAGAPLSLVEASGTAPRGQAEHAHTVPSRDGTAATIKVPHRE